MKTYIVLLILALSGLARASGISVLSARAGLPGYSVQDRHDELAIALIDVLGEIEIVRVDTPMKKIRLARLESSGGSVPPATIKEARWEIEADEVRENGRAQHADSLRQKMASLEALAAGKTDDFLNADLRSNEATLHYFEAELEAAKLDETYWGQRYAQLQALSLTGSSSPAIAHEAHRELKKSRVMTATWIAKCDEQTRQLAASRAELAAPRKP